MEDPGLVIPGNLRPRNTGAEDKARGEILRSRAQAAVNEDQRTKRVQKR